MVGVARDEAVAADAVVGLDPLDHVHRERDPSDPRVASRACRLGRTSWMGRTAHVSRRRGCSIDLDEQSGAFPPIRSMYRMGRRACAGSGDDQTRQAVPLPRRSIAATEEIVDGGNCVRASCLAPAVAGTG